MNKIKSIAIFCGSNEGNDTIIIDHAKQVGKMLAIQNITLVYGAAKIGIMGIGAEAVWQHQGKEIGVIPEFVKLKEDVQVGVHK